MMVAACAGGFLLLQPKWRSHASAPGGFRVELPAKPRGDMSELAKVKHQSNVHVEGTLLLVKLEEYSVVYVDIEPGTRRLLADDAILAEAVNGIRTETPGVQIVRDSPTAVSGFHAREVVFTHPRGGTFLARIVIADTRLYIASAGGGRTTAAGNDRIQRFLDSFEITDPKLFKKREEARRQADRLLEEEVEALLKDAPRVPKAPDPQNVDPRKMAHPPRAKKTAPKDAEGTAP